MVSGTYGAPRIHAKLAAQGIHIGRKRVARLMQAADLIGVSRRAFVTAMRRDLTAQPAPDLVQRAFAADAPDRLLDGGHHGHPHLGVNLKHGRLIR